jgi:hypothetical protein
MNCSSSRLHTTNHSHGSPTVAVGEREAERVETPFTPPRHDVEQQWTSAAGSQPERYQCENRDWDAAAQWIVEAQDCWMFVLSFSRYLEQFHN